MATPSQQSPSDVTENFITALMRKLSTGEARVRDEGAANDGDDIYNYGTDMDVDSAAPCSPRGSCLGLFKRARSAADEYEAMSDDDDDDDDGCGFYRRGRPGPAKRARLGAGDFKAMSDDDCDSDDDDCDSYEYDTDGSEDRESDSDYAPSCDSDDSSSSGDSDGDLSSSDSENRMSCSSSSSSSVRTSSPLTPNSFALARTTPAGTPYPASLSSFASLASLNSTSDSSSSSSSPGPPPPPPPPSPRPEDYSPPTHHALLRKCVRLVDSAVFDAVHDDEQTKVPQPYAAHLLQKLLDLVQELAWHSGGGGGDGKSGGSGPEPDPRVPRGATAKVPWRYAGSRALRRYTRLRRAVAELEGRERVRWSYGRA